MQEIPQSQQTPFHRIMGREARKKDKEFIGEVMVDWRDRPTTKELLEDGWFTHNPYSGKITVVVNAIPTPESTLLA